MTQEEKQLLLIELSARIPYQPLCKIIDTEYDFCECDRALGYSLRDFVGDKVIIKPYLRPMSSMTDEEWREYDDFCDSYRGEELYLLTDWLNAHHFDYRGLIEKGLALEAPEWMYKTE